MKALEWFECPHCHTKKYCSAQLFSEHMADCPERKNALQKQRIPTCRRCGTILTPVNFADGKEFLCSDCGWNIKVLDGGKLA